MPSRLVEGSVTNLVLSADTPEMVPVSIEGADHFAVTHVLFAIGCASGSVSVNSPTRTACRALTSLTVLYFVVGPVESSMSRMSSGSNGDTADIVGQAI